MMQMMYDYFRLILFNGNILFTSMRALCFLVLTCFLDVIDVWRITAQVTAFSVLPPSNDSHVLLQLQCVEAFRLLEIVSSNSMVVLFCWSKHRLYIRLDATALSASDSGLSCKFLELSSRKWIRAQLHADDYVYGSSFELSAV